MVVQYGEALTTDQQSDDPDNPEWTVRLEEYSEPVACARVATLEHDSDIYYCYVGEGEKDGTTEYFLLIVQVIDNEFFPVDTEDTDLWSALIGALLDTFGIQTDDGSDDDEHFGEEDPETDGVGEDPDTNVC